VAQHYHVYSLQDLVANAVRVENINNLAGKLSSEGHPDQQLIESRKEVRQYIFETSLLKVQFCK